MNEQVLPDPPNKERFVREMFDTIAPTYDLINRLMTFGIDQRWRRRTLELLDLSANALVLDIACGTGDFVKLERKQHLRSIGLDFSSQMLANAGGALELTQGSALQLPFRDQVFDAVTCGFALRNFADIQGVLSEAARVLKPGGTFAILEVSTPNSSVVRRMHHLYFHQVVPQIGRLVGAHKAYSYLPASVAYLPKLKELTRLAQGSGFNSVTRLPLLFDAAQLFLLTNFDDHRKS